MGEVLTNPIFGVSDTCCVFTTAVIYLDVAAVTAILEMRRAKRFLKQRLSYGCMFIHIAAAVHCVESTETRRKAKIIRSIINLQPYVHGRDDEGNTALHHASDIQTATTLLAAGLLDSTKNDQGQLPGETTPYEEVQQWFELRCDQTKTSTGQEN